jgi:catechol 2,3-dioxygenase-like lactoylglutathione lyase family enzyme
VSTDAAADNQPSDLLVTGFDHVQIAMPPGGERQARAFYGSVLGLQEVPKPSALAGRGGLWFVGPGLHLHLGVDDGFTPPTKAHIALLVPEREVARAALRAAGVDATDDDADIGVARFYCH